MTNFTLSIPKDLKKRIDAHPEVNWAEYLKQRLQLRLQELKKFEELKSLGRI